MLKLAMRSCGLTAVVLWCAALFAPFGEVYLGHTARIVPWNYYPSDTGPGWVLALLGPIGPLFLAPGWYANLALVTNVVQCVAGFRPVVWLATIGLIVAATALLPYKFVAPDIAHGHWDFSWRVLRGPALWLWLGAFALVWCASLVALLCWPESPGRILKH